MIRIIVSVSVKSRVVNRKGPKSCKRDDFPLSGEKSSSKTYMVGSLLPSSLWNMGVRVNKCHRERGSEG